MFQKIVVLKEHFSKRLVLQRFNKVRSYSAQATILPKPELTLGLTEEALKIMVYPQENIFDGNFFSAKMQI